MSLMQDIKWRNERFHQWKQNIVLSLEKMMRKETFWIAVVILLICLGLIVLTILGRSGPDVAEAHPFIIGPMY